MEKLKNRFERTCEMFRKDLDGVEVENDGEGTLETLGRKYSYELAMIGFELGYVEWKFTTIGSFNEVKRDFYDIVVQNELIEKVYSHKKIEAIKKDIMKARYNDDIR